MQRRKFLATVGSIAAGSAAVLGTGAYEGAYVHTERSFTMDVVSDSNAYLSLKPSSPFATLVPEQGGFEHRGSMLDITIDRLNTEADTRFDDVFRVQNTTGSEVALQVDDHPNWDGESSSEEHALQVWAQPTNGGSDVGSAVRIDTGNDITLGAGDEVEINLFFLFKQYEPNGSPGTEGSSMTFTADGTDS